MPLSPTTLASKLEEMNPTDSEPVAVDKLSTAWDEYFQGASVAGVAIKGSTAAAKQAMAAALLGMSQPGLGAAKIMAAVQAYWGVIATTASSLWVVPAMVVTPAVPPSTIAGIPAGLTAVFIANASGKLSLAAATQSIATVLHTMGGIGGITILTPPPPAPPAPTPIL